MPNVDEKSLIDVLYNGLKPAMQEVVKMKEPRGLRQHKEAVLKMESSAFCTFVNAGGSTSQEVKRTANTQWKSNVNIQKARVDGPPRTNGTDNTATNAPRQPYMYTREHLKERKCLLAWLSLGLSRY